MKTRQSGFTLVEVIMGSAIIVGLSAAALSFTGGTAVSKLSAEHRFRAQSVIAMATAKLASANWYDETTGSFDWFVDSYTIASSPEKELSCFNKDKPVCPIEHGTADELALMFSDDDPTTQFDVVSDATGDYVLYLGHRYHVTWNVRDAYPFLGTKTIRVVVMWEPYGYEDRITRDLTRDWTF